MSCQAMLVSLDNGVTWQNAAEGVRVKFVNTPVAYGDYDGFGELDLSVTSEGIITDVWIEDDNIGTDSELSLIHI